VYNFFIVENVELQEASTAMAKRSLEEDAGDERSTKRLRSNTSDGLSLLSHEILLRILSFLSVSDLVLCQRCASSRLDVIPQLTMQTLSTAEVPCC